MVLEALHKRTNTIIQGYSGMLRLDTNKSSLCHHGCQMHPDGRDQLETFTLHSAANTLFPCGGNV